MFSSTSFYDKFIWAPAAPVGTGAHCVSSLHFSHSSHLALLTACISDYPVGDLGRAIAYLSLVITNDYGPSTMASDTRKVA